MEICIVSAFPDFFAGAFNCGPTRAAVNSGSLSVSVVNPRDFTEDQHRTIDDYPFGGGPGMVMRPEPIVRAVESVRRHTTVVLLMTPRGRQLDQSIVRRLAGFDSLVVVCGRYKGVDERVVTILAAEEYSVGDYVLAGGEAAALVILEAVARLLPDAVTDGDSVNSDSFSDGILDAPYYTRPRVFRGLSVPPELLSGNHELVARWRRNQRLIATARRRPELLHREVLSEEERLLLLGELEKE